MADRLAGNARTGLVRLGVRHHPAASRLSPTEIRCVLTHEIIHAERGPAPGWARAREERAVDAEAARRLISLDALADALVWTPHLGEAAELLDVVTHALRARLDGLSAQEWSSLASRIEQLP